MQKNEIVEFVKNMKATDHVILLYTNPKEKHDVLFTYLKAGLERGEAAAYVAGQEHPEQIKQAMREFGIDVGRYEKNGALRVIDYRDWYIIDGKFDVSKTLGLWKKILDESTAKGFKGLRVTGEMVCFFENKMVKELVEYERALHKTLEIPLTAICAYDQEVVAKEGGVELLLDLLNAHSAKLEGAEVSRRLRKRVDEIFEGSGSVERLLVEVVDDTLKEILGKDATEVIYSYLKNEFSLGLEEIPRKPEVFSTVLKKVFGSGGQVLEKTIVENLYSKLQLERGEKEGFTFSDHVKFVLSHTPRHESARR